MSQFIQEAVAHHKGALRKYAKEHGTLEKNGNIDLRKTKGYIEKHEKGEMKTRRLREVNLAENLKRLRA
jgi:hypothetical protein